MSQKKPVMERGLEALLGQTMLDSSHNADRNRGAGLFRRVFAVCILLTLAGCGSIEGVPIEPHHVTPKIPSRDFTKLSCAALETEAVKLTADYKAMRGTVRSGTRDRYSVMNGFAIAINDAIRINDCKIANVRIPGNPLREKRNDP